MGYTDIINSISSVATAGALIWAFIQHRLDTKQLNKQMKEDREKYIQERQDFEETQIESRIQKLNERFDQYTEIYLIAEKLNWSLRRLKDEVSKADDITIEDYDSYFTRISSLLDELEPWQQAIIGDLPIDPLINSYYSYYDYTRCEDLLSWIEHFENQVKKAADDASKMTDQISMSTKKLQERLIQL